MEQESHLHKRFVFYLTKANIQHFLNSIFITGEEWKDIRSTFTPVFTSGKIKGMARLINDISVKLVDSLDADAKSGSEFDTRVKFGKFSMDSIASCAFGVDAQETDTYDVRKIFRFFGTPCPHLGTFI